MSIVSTPGRILPARTTAAVRKFLESGDPSNWPGSLYWHLVVVALIADISLTMYGRQLGLIELNPLARTVIETYGYGAMVPMKTIVVMIAVAAWTVLPKNQRWLAPLSVAIPWTAASLINLGLIVSILIS